MSLLLTGACHGEPGLWVLLLPSDVARLFRGIVLCFRMQWLLRAGAVRAKDRHYDGVAEAGALVVRDGADDLCAVVISAETRQNEDRTVHTDIQSILSPLEVRRSNDEGVSNPEDGGVAWTDDAAIRLNVDGEHRFAGR